MAASALSPASSPRLPSPPPIAEDQLGPKSPIATTQEQQQSTASLGNAAARRIRPGTKAEDMAEGPPLVDITEIDSAFQLTEHLKALHNFLTHPIGANTTIPVDRDMAQKLAQAPDNVDRTLWLYELCRFLIQKVNSIVIALFSDSPPCSSQTCPEMRASEWQYLCAVHDPPKSCCAIDYCCHTLDWAANILTSTKNFPSRLAMGNDQNTQHQQIRNLTNIFRRVYRIFAHAWFQHRDMFWKVEGRTGLYIFFKTVCDAYGLIPEDNYTIPAEAEGDIIEAAPTAPPLILRREPSGPGPEDNENSSIVEGITDHTLSTAGTTKRHRHSPSVGATAVSTVVEEAEEEDESTQKEPQKASQHVDEPSQIIESTDAQATASGEPAISEKAEASEMATVTGEPSPPESGGVSQTQSANEDEGEGDQAAVASQGETTEAKAETQSPEEAAVKLETQAIEEEDLESKNTEAEAAAQAEEVVATTTETATSSDEQAPTPESKKSEGDGNVADAARASDAKESDDKAGLEG